MTDAPPQRIGIFGGSFDPVHLGHLILAECCREQAHLDCVIFIPTAVSPHKVGSEPVSAEDRVEMLKLAIAGHAPFEVSTIEIERGGISYTVDTLQALSDGKGLPSRIQNAAKRDLFFLMGADSLEDFPTWREPERICALATPLIVSRPGSPAPVLDAILPFVPQSRQDHIANSLVRMPLIDISSTEIRSAAAAGKSIRYQTPRAVEAFIASNAIYSEPSAE